MDKNSLCSTKHNKHHNQQQHVKLSFLKIFLRFNLFLYSRFLLVIYFIHISIYIYQSQSPKSSHHLHHTPPPSAFPPQCSYICSLHLCLYFCLANQVICTILLDSTYMHKLSLIIKIHLCILSILYFSNYFNFNQHQPFFLLITFV